MSGKATVAHDDNVNAERLIHAIGSAGLSALRDGVRRPSRHTPEVMGLALLVFLVPPRSVGTSGSTARS